MRSRNNVQKVAKKDYKGLVQNQSARIPKQIRIMTGFDNINYAPRTIIRRALSILFLVFTSIHLFGQQVWPVQVTGFMIPPRSLDLGVYTMERSQDLGFNVTLNDPIQASLPVQLSLSIENNNNLIYKTDPNFSGPNITLSQFQQLAIDGIALQPYLSPSALVGATNNGMGSLEIPEGFNKVCLEVYGIDRNVPLSKKFCVQGSFQLNQTPLLSLPSCDAQMEYPETQNLIFNWTPMHIGSSNSPSPVEYQFELVRLPDGVTNANDAFETSIQVFQTTSMTPTLLYSQAEPLLEVDKLYAWRVKAYSLIHPTSKLFQNDGYSEICTFMYYGEDGPTSGNSNDKPSPTGCEVFDTDYGPVTSNDLEAVNIVEEDVVKLGYFDMVITQAVSTGQGFSGTGLVNFPMLRSKVNVNFSGLRVNNDLRAVEVQEVYAVVDQQFKLDASEILPVTIADNVDQNYISQLNGFFTNGNGINRLVSGLDPAEPQTSNLPLALDQEDEATVAVIGINFTPRNAYLNLVSWQEQDGEFLRLAGTSIPATPFGIKSGAHLVSLGGSNSGAENGTEITPIFSISYAGSVDTKMDCSCLGYKDMKLKPNVVISTEIMNKYGSTEAVFLKPKSNTEDYENYIGELKDIPDFTLVGLPGFEFKPKKAYLDLSQEQNLDNSYPNSTYTSYQESTWRGMILEDVEVKIPKEYDFTGKDKRITLDKGELFIDENDLAYGQMSKSNMLSLDDGRMGNWAYSVDKYGIEISDGQTNSAILEGNVQVPIFKELFDYSGTLEASNSGQIVLGVEIPQQPLSMDLWNAEFESVSGSFIDAKLIDVEGTKTFIPNANLNGKILMILDSIDIASGIQENGQIVISEIKQRLQYEGELSFELINLQLNGLILNPFDIPEDRIKLTSINKENATLKVGGKILDIGDVELLYNPSDGNSQEEIALKITAVNGKNQVGFEFWAKADNDGNFIFDRIEIDAKEINCECTSDVSNPSAEDIGLLIEEFYKNQYEFENFEDKTGSLASLDIPTNLGEKSKVLKVYKEAIKTHLKDVIYPNGILPVVGGIYVNFLKMHVEMNGINASTASGLTSKSAYTFEKINNNTNASGNKKLPIDLTNILPQVGFNGSIPDNTKLLITKLHNPNGSAVLELTLLVKIGNKYLSFSKDYIAFTSSKVSFKNLKLKLNETVTLNGNFPITFESTGNGISDKDSWVFIDCTDGLKWYNVQGYYAPTSTSKVRFADGLDANFGFRLNTASASSHDLNNFTALLKQTNNLGDPLEFSLADHGLLTFVPGENFKGYLDYSSNSNPEGMPSDYSRKNSGGTGGFKGLVFENLETKVTGLFQNSNETTPLTLKLNNFVLHPNHGMYGAADLNVVLTKSDGAKMDGWGYSLSKFNFSINDGNLENSSVNIEGILDVPVFAEGSEFNFTGTLGWDATAGQPTGNIIPDEDDLKDVFDVTWIPGLEINLDPGSMVEMHVQNGKFSPTAVFNGGAGIYFTPEMSIAGLDHSFEFGYDVFTFQNWKVNDHTIEGQGALKKIDFGVWGTKDKKKKRKRKKGRGKKGMKGFPITIEIPTFTTLQPDGTYEMDLGLSLNLMKGGAGGSKAGGKSKASGLRATTILEFDLDATGDRLEQNGVKLDSIDITGKAGPLFIRGIGVSIENDPVYGDAFKIGVQVKVPMGKKKVEIAGLAQFGTAAKASPGNFRYFFVDLQILMDPPRKLGKFNFHGLIGGFLYNMRKPSPMESLKTAQTTAKKGYQPLSLTKLMKKAASKVSKKKQAKMNLETYMGPGMSFTGEKYKPGLPADGGKYFGGYLEAVLSMGKKTYPIAIEVGLMAEFQENSAGDFGFSRLQIKGKGYLMPGSIPTRHEDNLGKGFVSLEYDHNEQRVSGALHIDVKIEAGKKSTNSKKKKALRVAAEIEGKLLLDWGGADEGSWYLKLGRPTKPLHVGVDAFGFGVAAKLYFQAGNKLDPPPPLRDLIPSNGAGDMGNKKPTRFGTSGVANGNGFMLGMGLNLDLGGNFGPFTAEAKVGLGFDISALYYDNIICNGTKKTDFGLDGLYFQGQIYGYASGSVGVDVNINTPFRRIQGSYKAIDVAANMVLGGAFPNPTQAIVKLQGRYSLFNGLASGNVDWQQRLGEGDIDLSCTPELSPIDVSSPGESSFVQTISVEDGAEGVHVFIEPEIYLNYEAGKVIEISEFNTAGQETGRKLLFMGGFEYLRLKHGNELADTWIDSPNSKKKLIKLNKLLKPETEYTLEYESKWEKQIIESDGTKSSWSKVTDSAPETGSITFTTGAMPQKIFAEALNYHAPGNKQKYWHKDYARPRIAFNNGDWSYLFPRTTTKWKTALQSSASMRQTLNMSNAVVNSLVEGIDFDYKVLVTEYMSDKSGTPTNTFIFPLSNYPMDKSFENPVVKIKNLGPKIKLPYIEIETESGKDVMFEGLNNIELKKGRIYNLKIIRDLASNTAIPSVKTALYQSELYNYWFRTSSYNSLKEKLSDPYMLIVFNNYDSGRRRSFHKEETDNDLKTHNQTTNYLYQIVPSKEDFDKYDLQRLIKNLKPSYASDFQTEKNLRNYVSNNRYNLYFNKSKITSSGWNSYFSDYITSVEKNNLNVWFNKIPNIIQSNDWYKFDNYTASFGLQKSGGVANLSSGAVLPDNPHLTFDGYDQTQTRSDVLVFIDRRTASRVNFAYSLQMALAYKENNLSKASDKNWGVLKHAFAGAGNGCNGCQYKYGYHGKIKLNFPKLSKWEDLGQEEDISLSPSLALTLSTPPANGSVATTSNNNNSVEDGTWSVHQFKSHSASNSYKGLKAYPTDKKPDEIWIVKKPGKRVLHWNGATLEGVVYKSDHSGDKVVWKDRQLSNTDNATYGTSFITSKMSLYKDGYSLNDLYRDGEYETYLRIGNEYYECDDCDHGDYFKPAHANSVYNLNNLFNKTSTPRHIESIKIPGSFRAVDFDNGGQGIAYNDKEEYHHSSGSNYRSHEGVDIGLSNNRGIYVGWINNGEWLKYTVDITSVGYYDIKVNHAGGNSKLSIDLDDVEIVSHLNISGSGETIHRVKIDKLGTHKLKMKFSSGMNYFGFEFKKINSEPFNGKPTPIPGSIDSYKFDKGDNLIGHFDQDIGYKNSTYYQTRGLIIEEFNVGEWLIYTIDVTETGRYKIGTEFGGTKLGNYEFHAYLNDKQVGTIKGRPYRELWSEEVMIEKGIYQLKIKSIINSYPEHIYFKKIHLKKVKLSVQAGKSPIFLPGKGQFEDFGSGGQGVAYNDTESSPYVNNSGGCTNVGSVNNDEWMAYLINVNTSGEYPLFVRHANASNNSKIKLVIDGIELGEFTLPSTGGATTYQTTYLGHHQISSDAKEIRFILSYGTNLDWFEFSTAQPTPYSYDYPNNIPGSIWTLDYGEGGIGIAHNDPRTYGVRDGFISGSLSSNYYQSSLPDRWIKYVVNVGASGKYNWEMEYLTWVSWNAQLFVDDIPVTTVKNMPSSHAQTVTRTLGEVELTEGQHIFKFLYPKKSAHIKRMIFNPAEQMPHSGSPVELPGTIQVEEYDLGGEGLAFHDETNDDVELNPAKNAVIGNNNEWLYYTVNLTESGKYNVTFNHSNNSGTHQVSLYVNGELVADNYNLIGGQTITTDMLSDGEQVIELKFHNNGTIVNAIDFELPPQPYAGASNEIPGIIEMEDFNTGGQGKGYSDQDNVNDGGVYRTNVGADIYNKSEATANVGGGTQSTYVRAGANEWLSYTANITTAGMYAVTARYCAAADSKMIFSIDGSEKGGNGKSKLLKSTGGNCESKDYEETLLGYYNLPVGEHVIRLNMKTGTADIDYLSFESAIRESWSGTSIDLPGRIEAEHFDKGGEGIGYADKEEGPPSGKQIELRPNEDVEVRGSAGNESIGYTGRNQWTAYTVNVANGGAYVFKVRHARSSGSVSLKILLDDDSTPIANITLPHTGSWSTFKVTTGPEINLPEGEHVIKIQTPSNGSVNLDWFEFVQSQPYNGQAQTIPGKVEAEFYDEGGEGLAFHKSSGTLTPYNYGGSVGKVIAYISSGDWAQYTIDVQSDGYYELYSNMASIYSDKKISIEIDGKEVTTDFLVPNTSKWETPKSVKVGEVQLTRGLHKLRWTTSTARIEFNYFEFKKFEPGNLEVTGNGNVVANDINNNVSIDNLTKMSSNKRKEKIVQFRLSNSGGRPLEVSNIEFGSNTNKNVFSFSNPPNLPLTVPVGGSKMISISFNPREVEKYKGAVVIKSNNEEGDFIFPIEGLVTEGRPYKDITPNIPGEIYAYKFDEGGKNIDYYDTSSGSHGDRKIRPSTDVEIYNRLPSYYRYYYYCNDCVQEARGEWLHYTVNVQESGTYTLEGSYHNYSGGEIAIEKKTDNGYSTLGTLTFKRYGYESYRYRYWWWWRTGWRYISPGNKTAATSIHLEKGSQTLRVRVSSGNVYLSTLKFTKS